MSDFKSKLPNVKELASMTSKLYSDIKKSVGEIVQSYKENRSQQAKKHEPVNTKAAQQPTRKKEKTESKPVQKRTTASKKHTADEPEIHESKK